MNDISEEEPFAQDDIDAEEEELEDEEKQKKERQMFVEKMGSNGRLQIFVVVPFDKHFDQPSYEVINVLKTIIPEQHQGLYQDFCKVIEVLCEIQFFDIKRKLKKNFIQFASASKGADLYSIIKHGPPSQKELDNNELTFLQDFVYLMKISHYQQLLEYEWDQAVKETYMFNLPVEINWNYMDSKLFSKFWANDPSDNYKGLDFFSKRDRIMVFHRGIGVSQTQGFFFYEKLDMLVDFLVQQPFEESKGKVYDLYKQVRKMLGRREEQKRESGQEFVYQFNRSSRSRRTGSTLSESDSYQGDDNLIERRTLSHLLPTYKEVIRNFLTVVQLQEPTFQNVIVLYRKGDDNKSFTGSKDEEKYAKRNMYIKSFDEVAMADLEIIFPQKKVIYKPLTVISVFTTFIFALLTFLYILVKNGRNLSYSVVISAITVSVVKIAQSFVSAEQEKSDLQNSMNEMTYERSQNSQEGVLFSLIENMKDDYYKEVMFVYTTLLSQSKQRQSLNGEDLVQEGLTVEDLKTKITDIIGKKFDKRVNFDTEAALRHLDQFEILNKKEVKGVEYISAKPLNEAYLMAKTMYGESFDFKEDVDFKEKFQNKKSFGQQLLDRVGLDKANVEKLTKKPKLSKVTFSDAQKKLVQSVQSFNQVITSKKIGQQMDQQKLLLDKAENNGRSSQS